MPHLFLNNRSLFGLAGKGPWGRITHSEYVIRRYESHLLYYSMIGGSRFAVWWRTGDSYPYMSLRGMGWLGRCRDSREAGRKSKCEVPM